MRLLRRSTIVFTSNMSAHGLYQSCRVERAWRVCIARCLSKEASFASLTQDADEKEAVSRSWLFPAVALSFAFIRCVSCQSPSSALSKGVPWRARAECRSASFSKLGTARTAAAAITHTPSPKSRKSQALLRHAPSVQQQQQQ